MPDTGTLEELFERDRIVWDECADQYEQSIVSGHPDIIAYEEFEEDFLDRLLIYLMRDEAQDVHLYDVGCGSARLHLHYGLKSTNADLGSEDDAKVIRRMRKKNVRHGYDPVFDSQLKHIGGLDFSEEMINIATDKLKLAGLGKALEGRQYLEVGSAFDMHAISGPELPLAVSVCNSIGVMQGPLGAQQLFVAMRRAVEDEGGIAIISCYRRRAITTHALGNYESTMNVSGQPTWLEPNKYADPAFVKMPRRFKRAHDSSDSIKVNVYDQDGERLETDYTMRRDPEAVEELCETGHIRMHSDYESRWYSTRMIEEWIEEYWSSDNSHHLFGADIDVLRGEPMQFAIYDPQHHLDDYLRRCNLEI